MSVARRMGRPVRHFVLLLYALVAYCAVNRTIWPLVVTFVLLAIAFLTFATYVVTPFLYTVF